jgi:hypothetical protein
LACSLLDTVLAGAFSRTWVAQVASSKPLFVCEPSRCWQAPVGRSNNRTHVRLRVHMVRRREGLVEGGRPVTGLLKGIWRVNRRLLGLLAEETLL